MHHGQVTPEIALKKRIEAAKIPPSSLDETIKIAVSNVRANSPGRSGWTISIFSRFGLVEATSIKQRERSHAEKVIVL